MVLRIDENGPFETTNGGKRVSTPTVELGQQAEDGGFSGFRAELNIMFRAVVEAALGVFEIPMLKEALPHLAVGHSQALLVADRPVIGKGLVERFNCVLPALFAGLLKRQVVIEDAERPVIVQCAEQVQRLQIIRTGFRRLPHPDVQIAQIDQRMGDGMGILFGALDVQHFAIAALGRIEILTERTGIAQIAERIGKLLSIIRPAVVRDGGFPGRSRLGQIPSMEKDPRSVLVRIGHDGQRS